MLSPVDVVSVVDGGVVGVLSIDMATSFSVDGLIVGFSLSNIDMVAPNVAVNPILRMGGLFTHESSIVVSGLVSNQRRI